MESSAAHADERDVLAERLGLAAFWQRFVRPKLGVDELSARDALAIEASLRSGLASHDGEEAARKNVAAVAERYRTLSPDGRRKLLVLLAAFDTEPEAIASIAAEYAALPPSHERAALKSRLRKALDAPRSVILRRFNAAHDGVKFLVDMRADLLASLDDPQLAELEADLKAVLSSWFDVGFLELRRITWDAPASLLERLAAYEAVHEMRGWTDLKNRLDHDRRCYAFFHPAMPDEPLIFIEVALTNELPARVGPLLDPHAPVGDPAAATVAVFYSISNCQRGLDGISLGNALIKRVVGEIAAGLPGIRRFGTLSPLPGFRSWLERAYATASESERLLLAAIDQRGWQRDTELTSALREPFLRLCARYLLDERRAGGRALDPVANFHLSNGASIESINWMGDTSKRGLRESAGMMVNYLYRLDRIDVNQAAYAAGRIEASPAVTRWNDGDSRPSSPGVRNAGKALANISDTLSD